MKKLLAKISLVAVIATMGLIGACGESGTNNSTTESPAACEHSGGKATCTAAAVCEKCGEAYGEALGHSHEAVVTAPTCTAKGFTTNPTQLGNLEKALANNNLTFTKDETALTITIEWNSTENLVITNNGTTTAYVSGVEIVYE